MKFIETIFDDVFVVKPETISDERGVFIPLFSHNEFFKYVDFKPIESGVSHNLLRGTVRGLHYQVAPFAQAKLVRCAKGRIFDAVVDLATFKWFGVELKENEMIYIPNNYAHGFQTLVDDSIVEYLSDGYYNPLHEKGLLWNDPDIGIEWTIKEGIIISEKDKNLVPSKYRGR